MYDLSKGRGTICKDREGEAVAPSNEVSTVFLTMHETMKGKSGSRKIAEIHFICEPDRQNILRAFIVKSGTII